MLSCSRPGTLTVLPALTGKVGNRTPIRPCCISSVASISQSTYLRPHVSLPTSTTVQEVPVICGAREYAARA